MATRQGVVKKTLLEQYSRPRQNGITAIAIREDDRLVDVKLTDNNSDVLIGIHSGKAIRFHEKRVRIVGRNSLGVKGITLDENDFVVGMITVKEEEEDILVVSENGYGKRSSIVDYRVTNRGGKGIKTLNVTAKTGKMITIKGVLDTDDLMIITKKGLTIRTSVSTIRHTGRNAQGVRLINLKDGDQIAAVTYVEANENREITDNENSNLDTDDLNSDYGEMTDNKNGQDYDNDEIIENNE